MLAHELSHVANRDILIATIAAAVAGLVSALGHAIQWGAILGMGRRDDERGREPDRRARLGAPRAAHRARRPARGVTLARVRRRRVRRRAASADPEPLAEALLALEQGNEVRPYEFGGPATAHLFIVNPFSGIGGKMLSLFSTHPPLEERVRRLREMKRGDAVRLEAVNLSRLRGAGRDDRERPRDLPARLGDDDDVE